MITNERQYRITNAQLERLRGVIESFDLTTSAKRTKSDILARAELAALQSELESLAQQIQQYETLRSGTVEILKASSLEELPLILIRARIAAGFSQRQLAEAVGLREQQIQRYEAEEYASASLRRLADISGALNLNIREIAAFRMASEPLGELNEEDLAWDQFPIREMYLRNWFEGFSGSLPEAIANCEELVRKFVRDSLESPVSAAARQRVRSGGIVNRYALFAWQCRVVSLAKEKKLANRYKQSTITHEWLTELVHLSCSADGPRKAVERLERAGIRVVILPHLSQTHLDGAAFLLPNGSPVVAMTLRYDRLDNFWFVLVHELVHVMKHLHKGRVESIFDDLDADADDIEREADQEVGEILIPDDRWETALARYIRSRESIQDFANEMGIHSAIVAGKIRREANNYAILVDTVGQGEVRKLFPETCFS